MRIGAAVAVAVAALAAAAPAAAQDRKAELQQLAFETCPKVLDGSLSLDNPADLATLGFASTEPRETPAGKLPRAAKGSGTDKVVLSSGPKTCSLWFGGPDNASLAGGMIERALALKWSGSTTPRRLGDGTMVFVFRDKVAKRSVVVILADAGGELDFAPATTVIVMNEKD
ncbi:MAG TPA: hypothetical protein VFV30_01485 [Novosphingobium sp.]|nr:hypothetical protein [Novosphingobium sp.]